LEKTIQQMQGNYFQKLENIYSGYWAFLCSLSLLSFRNACPTGCQAGSHGTRVKVDPD